MQRILPPVRLIWQAWSGRYSTKGSPEKADCLIVFSFGYRGRRKQATPGLSNQDLANLAIKYYAELPKIMQFEVADAYTAAHGPDNAPIVRIEKHRKPGVYLDTREVAVQAKRIMAENGWKSPVLLAHPYHMPRVQAVCSSLKIDWSAGKEEVGAVEFDPLSSQGWTTSLDKWRGYEPLAIIYYRMKGWL